MMKLRSKSPATLLALLGLAVGSAAPAGAQDAAGYPTAGRSIRLIVPHGAGAGADILARLVGPKLAERWKVNVIADNRTGASGDIGIVAAAGAEPDGYTLLCVATVFTINPFMKKNPPYDPVKSFVPVSLLATSVLSFLVGPKVPAKTLPEFVALAHKQPGKLNYASSGIGSPQFVTMELLKLETKSDIVHIPYKDAPSMFRGMLTDEVQAQIQPLQTAAPQVANGNARMLAVMSANRAPAFPDVPTMRDLGYPNFVVETWYGVFAPAGTPPAIVNKLNAALQPILASAAMKERIVALGAEPASSTPDELGKRLADDLVRLEPIVKRTGAKLE
jgi:tripartite-type tricarboxylate transporter receptor subunit TctC